MNARRFRDPARDPFSPLYKREELPAPKPKANLEPPAKGGPCQDCGTEDPIELVIHGLCHLCDYGRTLTDGEQL